MQSAPTVFYMLTNTLSVTKGKLIKFLSVQTLFLELLNLSLLIAIRFFNWLELRSVYKPHVFSGNNHQ